MLFGARPEDDGQRHYSLGGMDSHTPMSVPICNFGWVEQDHDVVDQKADSVDAEPWCHAFYDKTDHPCSE
jgi:hypothetical protein